MLKTTYSLRWSSIDHLVKKIEFIINLNFFSKL